MKQVLYQKKKIKYQYFLAKSTFFEQEKEILLILPKN
jgi:hypothetical protein